MFRFSRAKLCGGAFCLLALQYIALGAWMFSGRGPGFEGSNSYSTIADGILSTGAFQSAYRPPVYPLFLAGTKLIFGSSWETGAFVLQALVGIFCGFLVMRIAARITKNPWAGPLALVLYTAYFLLHFELRTKRETALYILFLLLFFEAWLSLKPGWRRLFSMTAAAALAHLTRPNGIVLFPITLFICWRENSYRLTRTFFSQAIVSSAVFFLIIAPWQLYIYRTTGIATISSSTLSGLNLWKGANPEIYRFWPWVDTDYYEPWIRKAAGGLELDDPKSNPVLNAQAKEFIRQDPIGFARLGVLKAIGFFSPVPIPFGSGKLVEENGVVTLTKFRYRSLPLLAAHTVYFSVILLGWILFLRRTRNIESPGREFATVTSLVIAMNLFICCVSYSELRYRMPLDPLLIVMAAVALSEILRQRVAHGRILLPFCSSCDC